MFKDIASLLQKTFPDFKSTSEEQIPSSDILNHGFTHKNLNDKNLRFSIQDETLPFAELGYEERIYLQGLIATRKQNWHDFFNSMVWHKYPETKSNQFDTLPGNSNTKKFFALSKARFTNIV